LTRYLLLAKTSNPAFLRHSPVHSFTLERIWSVVLNRSHQSRQIQITQDKGSRLKGNMDQPPWFSTQALQPRDMGSKWKHCVLTSALLPHPPTPPHPTKQWPSPVIYEPGLTHLRTNKCQRQKSGVERHVLFW
jgi:hypothetical protein